MIACMNPRDLKCAGVFIYACEGTKLRRDLRGKNTFVYALDVTNSNPLIISTYVRFLKEILKLDPKRIKCQLFTYDRDNEKKLKNFWSQASTIPLAQFQKSILLKARGSKYKPNPLGTLKVRYSSKHDWIRLDSIVTKMLTETAGEHIDYLKKVI